MVREHFAATEQHSNRAKRPFPDGHYLAIAAVMPMMETIPFSANIAGVALTALITSDGLLALLAFVFAAGAFTTVLTALL